jgi:hypothetical protein
MARLSPCKIPTISIARVGFQPVNRSHNLLGRVRMMNRFIEGMKMEKKYTYIGPSDKPVQDMEDQ